MDIENNINILLEPSDIELFSVKIGMDEKELLESLYEIFDEYDEAFRELSK